MKVVDLNLYIPKTSRSKQYQLYEKILRYSSTIAGSLLIFCLLCLLIIHFFLQQNIRKFVESKQEYLSLLKENAQNELMIRYITDKMQIFHTVRKTQTNYDKILNTAYSVINPEIISSLSIDTENRITMSSNFKSYTDLFSLIGYLQKAEEDNAIRDAIITSISISEKSEIMVSFSFLPVIL
jgi:hypothetical protein